MGTVRLRAHVKPAWLETSQHCSTFPADTRMRWSQIGNKFTFRVQKLILLPRSPLDGRANSLSVLRLGWGNLVVRASGAGSLPFAAIPEFLRLTFGHFCPRPCALRRKS